MGNILENLTGKHFGGLIVLKFSHRKANRTYWICKCIYCNKIKAFRADFIKRKPQSCGCIRNKLASIRCKNLGYSRKTHGLTNNRIYKIYHNMKDRCYRQNNRNYKNYGARGIRIYKEWLDDFLNFYKWAIQNGYNNDLTIERIDVNGNYEPKNCKWIRKNEQTKNRRNSIFLTYNGKTLSLKEWSEKLNLSYRTLYSRYKKNLNIEKILRI